jgi:hypothetical protein
MEHCSQRSRADHTATKAAVLYRTAAGEELVQANNKCDDKQEMNESSRDVKREACKPQHQQNEYDCPEHLQSFQLSRNCGAIVNVMQLENVPNAR